jgi:hypothetical protein
MRIGGSYIRERKPLTGQQLGQPGLKIAPIGAVWTVWFRDSKTRLARFWPFTVCSTCCSPVAVAHCSLTGKAASGDRHTTKGAAWGFSLASTGRPLICAAYWAKTFYPLRA